MAKNNSNTKVTAPVVEKVKQDPVQITEETTTSTETDQATTDAENEGMSTTTQDTAEEKQATDTPEETVAESKVVKEVASAPEEQAEQVLTVDEYAAMPVQIKLAFQAIDEYVLAMTPNTLVDPIVGARQQVSLYRAISTILNKSGESFNDSFNELLARFKTHADGVFHETNVYRFTEHVELNKADLDASHRFINMLTLTADAKGRKVSLKQIDMIKTLAYGVTEEARQQVLAFFHIQ